MEENQGRVAGPAPAASPVRRLPGTWRAAGRPGQPPNPFPVRALTLPNEHPARA
jgi:hypothetical protein